MTLENLINNILKKAGEQQINLLSKVARKALTQEIINASKSCTGGFTPIDKKRIKPFKYPTNF